MNKFRLELVRRVFEHLRDLHDDQNGDFITFQDVKTSYNVKNHPKYLNGEKSERQILNGFIANFEGIDLDANDGKEKVTDGQVRFLNDSV